MNGTDEPALTTEHWQGLREQIAALLGLDPADLYPAGDDK